MSKRFPELYLRNNMPHVTMPSFYFPTFKIISFIYSPTDALVSCLKKKY